MEGSAVWIPDGHIFAAIRLISPALLWTAPFTFGFDSLRLEVLVVALWMPMRASRQKTKNDPKLPLLEPSRA